MSTRRWRDWTPNGLKKIEGAPGPEPAKPAKGGFAGFAGSPPGPLHIFEAPLTAVDDGPVPEKPPRAELGPVPSPVEILGACTCDEKPYPHLRHRDGTGPGSGRALDPYDRRQAHRKLNRY